MKLQGQVNGIEFRWIQFLGLLQAQISQRLPDDGKPQVFASLLCHKSPQTFWWRESPGKYR
jgi:hypothetical protein